MVNVCEHTCLVGGCSDSCVQHKANSVDPIDCSSHCRYVERDEQLFEDFHNDYSYSSLDVGDPKFEDRNLIPISDSGPFVGDDFPLGECKEEDRLDKCYCETYSHIPKFSNYLSNQYLDFAIANHHLCTRRKLDDLDPIEI